MDRLDTLVFENKLSSASSLIGKTVQGLHDQGFRVAGNVETVLRQGDQVALQLDTGWLLAIENIEIIQEPRPPQPAPTP